MLTQKQLSSIIINAIVVKMLITFPRSIFAYCGNAACLAMIYGLIIALVLFYFTHSLYRTKFNVIELAQKCGGASLRVITGVCVFLVLGLNFLSVMRVFPEIIRLVLLQKTYVEIIVTVFVICIIFGGWCGIESIARVHQLFMPVAGLVFAAFIIMLIPDLHIGYILPIFGNGLKSIFIDGMPVISAFSDLLMLNILIPRMKEPENYKKSGYKAISIGGACAIIIFIVYGLCYSYPGSAEFIVPIYQLERRINLSDFFSRLEALFQFIWSISILLYSALYVAVLAKVWAETFKLHHTKPLIAPSVITLLGISILPESLNDMIHLEDAINRWLYIPAFAIPIVIGVIYNIKMFHVKQSTTE